MMELTVEVSEKIHIFKCKFASYPAFFKKTALMEGHLSNRSLEFHARIPGPAC
jgi:hypothetical protein